MVTDLRLQYKRHFLEFELVGSIVLTLIIFGYFSWNNTDVSALITISKDKLYPIITASAITLLGFIITGVSVLVTFTESKNLQIFKKSNQYKTPFTVYFSTIKYLTIVTILSIIGILSETYKEIIFFLLIWSVAISSLRLYRCVWIIERFIDISKERS